jgi:hypothetical protein
MIYRLKYALVTLYLPLMILGIIPVLMVLFSLMLGGCATIDAIRNVDR